MNWKMWRMSPRYGEVSRCFGPDARVLPAIRGTLGAWVTEACFIGGPSDICGFDSRRSQPTGLILAYRIRSHARGIDKGRINSRSKHDEVTLERGRKGKAAHFHHRVNAGRSKEGE